jgi:hypothetical protein
LKQLKAHIFLNCLRRSWAYGFVGDGPEADYLKVIPTQINP